MKLAMWLLERFSVLERNESLLGDLVEERSAGRSVLWLWWQTLAAIADSVARDLREHWVLALRAILMGWSLQLIWGQVVNAIDRHEIGRMYVFPWRPGLWVFLFTVFVWPTVVGWLVARTHRAHQAAMVLAFAASMAMWAAWYLTVHYNDLHHGPVADQWSVDLTFNCIIILGVLMGGLLSRFRRRIS